MLDPAPATWDDDARRDHHACVRRRLDALLEGEDDWVSAMATVACELHHAFAYFHWTGFYRALDARTLAIGPYQGGHGCLRIDLARGVCGAAARTRTTQRVADVTAFPGHIACSAATRSELVVPILRTDGRVLAVLDVDSDLPDAFSDADLKRGAAARSPETREVDDGVGRLLCGARGAAPGEGRSRYDPARGSGRSARKGPPAPKAAGGGETDQEALESLCAALGARFGDG